MSPQKKSPEKKSPPKKFYEGGLQFECTGCGECCKTHGDYAFVYLAEKDQKAACELLKMKRIDFLNEYCATDEHGSVHLTMVDGNCNFLDENNRCNIYSARPMQCRTWPFWTENIEDAQEWNGPVKECCEGVGKGKRHSKEEIEASAKKRDDWYGIDF